MENAQGGELFDFIANSGQFTEAEARYFFKQFMQGLDYCHNKQVAHRDLKPENLLLDKDYNLKIADFGFAAPTDGKDGQGYLYTKLGTLNYMAPEIHLEAPYQGKQVDIFAAAIILFILVAKHPPFSHAKVTDPYYKCIAGNRADIFWKTHSRNKPGGENFFSKEFQELLTCMLQVEPSHRPSMAEIMAHAWMQKPTPTAEEIKNSFIEREQSVKAALEAERQQKIQQREQMMSQRRQDIRAMRSGAAGLGADSMSTDLSDEALDKPTKQMEDYDNSVTHKAQFFTSYNPDLVEETLVQHLTAALKIEPLVSKSKYKVKFTLYAKDELDPQVNDNVEIVIKILSVPETNLCCVEFNR